MKYLNEAKALVSEMFREDWMNDDEWVEFTTAVFAITGLTYEQLAKNIEDGVEKGYSIEEQISVLKTHLKNNE